MQYSNVNMTDDRTLMAEDGYLATPMYDRSKFMSFFNKNQSSTSTDSTSPESCHECCIHSDTPLVQRRAIYGRKILGASGNDVHTQTSRVRNSPSASSVWSENETPMSSQVPNLNSGKWNDDKYKLYELFPQQQENQKPISPCETNDSYLYSDPYFTQDSSNLLPNTAMSSTPLYVADNHYKNINPSHMSSNFASSSQSSSFSPPSFFESASSSDYFRFPPNQNVKDPITLSNDQSSIKYPMIKRKIVNMSKPQPNKLCSFCRKNGETALVYMTHNVRDKIGNRTVVTCPILRSHVCPTCGGTGDKAHTITYCPVARNTNNGNPMLSTTITLKNTRIKSNGRKRY